VLGTRLHVVYMDGEPMGGGKLFLACVIMWCTWLVNIWEAGRCAWHAALCGVQYMAGDHMGGGKVSLARGIMCCTWLVNIWEAGRCAWHAALCGVHGW